MKKEQRIITDYTNLNDEIDLSGFKNILVVCSRSLVNSFFVDYLKSCNPNIYIFNSFRPNPKYEEVVDGIKCFKDNNCDLIIALGGGSAIDVAKSIKAFVNMDDNYNYLEQEIVDNDVKMLAVPTTAGTGSESTTFAVVYYNGNKYSVDSEYLLPDYVLLESKFLDSLSLYQKKSTMLDALCQGIESYWSVNSTSESRTYASIAIKLILDNYKEYINGNKDVYPLMLLASNYSGKAINISKTTAAHAMSYKITSLYGISHGHAVSLCLPYVWEYMINNSQFIYDSRGNDYLEKVFSRLDSIFECIDHQSTIEKFYSILSDMGIEYSNIINEKDLDELVSSVNVKRLKNNPVSMDKCAIETVYRKLL